MIQIEINKNQVQLQKTKHLLLQLEKIDVNKKCDTIEFGSIVETNNGNYFISIPFGTIDIDSKNFFVISLISPLGQVLNSKTEGNTLTFQNKEFSILKLS